MEWLAGVDTGSAGRQTGCAHCLQNEGSADVQLLLVYGAGQRVYEKC